MTKQEAIIALKEGKKIRHRYFDNHEWVKQDAAGFFITEDGVVCTEELFWQLRNITGWETGWEITVD